MLTQDQLNALKISPGGPNRVRLAMSLAGVTQVQLAQALGVSQPYISAIVRGSCPRLPLEITRRLAQHFGCSIEDLFPAREAVA